MDCSEAGKKGGQSRSAAKRASSSRNLELARRIRAEIPAAEKEAALGNITEQSWLDDARKALTYLEEKPARHFPVLVTMKAGN
jgi:SOS response regulatory protein OraA/RecX